MPIGAIIGGSIVSGILSNNAADTAAGATRDAANTSTAEQKRQFDLTRTDTAPYRDVGQASLYRLSDMFGLTPQGGYASQRQPAPLTPADTSEMDRIRAQLAAGAGGSGMVSGSETPVDIPGMDPQTRAGLEARLAELQARQGGTLNGGPGTYQAGGPGSFNERTGTFGPSGTLTPGAPGTPSAPGQSVADMVLASSPGYQFRLGEGMKALDRNQSKYRFTPRAAKEMERYSQGFASNEFGNFLESQFRLAGMGGNAVNTSASAGANAANGISNAAMYGGAGAANAAIAGAAGTNNAIQSGIGNYTTLQMYNNMRPQPAPFYGAGAAPY